MVALICAAYIICGATTAYLMRPTTRQRRAVFGEQADVVASKVAGLAHFAMSRSVACAVLYVSIAAFWPIAVIGRAINYGQKKEAR